MSDNFKLILDDDSLDNLRLALQIVLSKHKKVTHWNISTEKGLVFFWHDDPDYKYGSVIPFPSPISDPEQLKSIVVDWLKEADYGVEPDQDGSNHKGYSVYIESWSQVGDSFYSMVGIHPCWMMYGK